MSDLSAVVSVAVSGRSVFGNKRVTWGIITLGDGSSTMPAAGLAVTAAQLGMTSIDFIHFTNELTAYGWLGNVLKAGAGAVVPANGDKVYFMAFGSGLG